MFESLDVSSNNLELIPAGIASMRSLKELILSDNQLKEIPDGEYQITALSICVTKYFIFCRSLAVKFSPNTGCLQKHDGVHFFFHCPLSLSVEVESLF